MCAAQRTYGSALYITGFSDSNLAAFSAYYDQGNDPLKTQDALVFFWLELLEVNMNLRTGSDWFCWN